MCGDVIAPFALITIFSSRLGIQYWGLAVAASAGIAVLIVSPAVNRHLDLVYRPPLFVVAWMLLTVFSVGIYADWARKEKISEFKPDKEMQHSFFRSIREAPREFQFYLHSAVLKDCIPYVWSYSQMALVRLKPNVAVNVLPPTWLAQCQIKRTG
jgi:hypothetical protein